MSSFRRTAKTTTSDTSVLSLKTTNASETVASSTAAKYSQNNVRLIGSKPWLNSQALVSSGLRQLDEILGGGLLLGSVLLLEEDELFGAYAECILSYGYVPHHIFHPYICCYLNFVRQTFLNIVCIRIAESISTGCTTLLVVNDSSQASKLLSSLPQNLSMKIVDTEREKEVHGRDSHVNKEVVKTVHDEKALMGEAADGNPKLKIAWQYGKYLSGVTNPNTVVGGHGQGEGQAYSKRVKSKTNYCCSYDISERLQPFLRERNPTHVLLRKGRRVCELIKDVEAFVRK